MSLLEIHSRNMGRELTVEDVESLRHAISSAGAMPRSVDLWIGATLAIIRLLDVAHRRVAASEAARLRAERILKIPYDIFDFVE